MYDIAKKFLYRWRVASTAFHCKESFDIFESIVTKTSWESFCKCNLFL